MNFKHVKGENKGKIVLFALSTCGWCNKTRKLIEELGVGYDYVYVDLLEGADRDEAVEALKIWNSNLSFPTLVINDQECIVGFDQDKIMELIG
ncbi:MAG TPA: glutaredoxin family protein [Methanobacteriaceae archaeon]|jgi:glutaredoxin-like protein NrdH|nr:glutaredoxin family protein [Euryarchaeota archaeon]HNR25621.1 glutaredoxin family protein [Methanobacteriaceae archaeon]HNS24624.1 glutaredoxin family protein [Methanobacteriaceae archaeon]